MRIEITRCYLVQVLDDEGNELASDYDFVATKKEAMETGKEMLRILKERKRNGDSR